MLVCQNCGTHFEYHPETKITPYLVFDREPLKPYTYDINNDIIIGRDSRGFLSIYYEKDESLKENCLLRSYFISEKHARIRVKNEPLFRQNEEAKEIINRLKCAIEDFPSKNGTQVNGALLKLNEQRELKNNDVIILAPSCDRYVTIIFKERFEDKK